MRPHFTLAALAVLSAIAPPTALAQSPVSPPRTIEVVAREVIDVSGGGRIGIQVVQQMLPALKKMSPTVPDEFWSRFMDEIRLDDLVDLAIPIYVKHFSKDDLEALLAFYRSPAGQRLLKEMPAVMQESMLAGQQWGQRIAERALVRAQEYEDERASDPEDSDDTE